MNYENFDFRERYNEVMYDERDVIVSFLKKQYDIRYGRQRDTWHFEPAVRLIGIYGCEIAVTDAHLDKNKFVTFTGVCCNERNDDYECTNFAYGELSKVIEALPDASEINKKNAINDLKAITRDYNTNAILREYPFEFNGHQIKDIEDMGEEGIKLVLDTKSFTLDTTSAVSLRDHLNVSILHGYSEYKKLVKFLSEQPNLCFEPADWGHVMFTIHGTDVKVDVLSASLDANDKLQLCVDDDGQETLWFEEKDIRPEYLVDLVGYIEDHHYCDIIDTYNSHNEELVRKINAAWKSEKYHNTFSEILLALLVRDHDEYLDKYCEIEDYSGDWAMKHAHEIMEGICDDQDLETILSFIRYED